MKLIATFSLLLLSLFGFAQNKKVVQNNNGVELVYEIVKVDSSNAKKIKYSISATAVNNNNYDVFYEVASGSMVTDFVSIRMDNSTGIFKDNLYLKGDATNYRTDNNKVLLKIEAKKKYTQTEIFNVKTGEQPVITAKFTADYKKFEKFNLEVFTKEFVDGLWKTACGNNTLVLTLTNNVTRPFIVQIINGKQVKWVQTSANVFAKEIEKEVVKDGVKTMVKETDPTVLLFFNKQTKNFIYTSAEGITVEWVKP